MTAVKPLLVDNWTLQNAGEMLHEELSEEIATDIEFSTDKQSFNYAAYSKNLVSLECLCQLLHYVVLEERLVVDSQFIDRWSTFPSLVLLQRERLITAKPLLERENEWGPTRASIEELLCFCPPLRVKHEQNKKHYELHGRPADEFLSALVWGGAGMLARASFLRAPYAAHPQRERLLTTAGLVGGVVGVRFARFLDRERLKVFHLEDREQLFGKISLPPVAAEVLSMSSSMSEIVPRAIEMRSKYAELRSWLQEFQAALDAGDIHEVLAREKVLNEVAGRAEKLIRRSASGSVSIEFGLSFAGPTVSGSANLSSASQKLLGRFGIHAQIQSLLLARPGVRAFGNFMRVLGRTNERLAISLQQEFTKRHGMAE